MKRRFIFKTVDRGDEEREETRASVQDICVKLKFFRNDNNNVNSIETIELSSKVQNKHYFNNEAI